MPTEVFYILKEWLIYQKAYKKCYLSRSISLPITDLQ